MNVKKKLKFIFGKLLYSINIFCWFRVFGSNLFIVSKRDFNKIMLLNRTFEFFDYSNSVNVFIN